MYKLYLASDREPRLGTQLIEERNQGGLWDSTIGGRVGILRYGTANDFWPQGWQLDVEAAAYPRLDAHRNLIESDFRAGIPLTTRQGPWEMKAGYVHNCSHIGDLYLQTIPFSTNQLHAGLGGLGRGNVSQSGLAAIRGSELGLPRRWRRRAVGIPVWRRFHLRRPTGLCSALFFAINGHLRR